jgi:hypothetical protein
VLLFVDFCKGFLRKSVDQAGYREVNLLIPAYWFHSKEHGDKLHTTALSLLCSSLSVANFFRTYFRKRIFNEGANQPSVNVYALHDSDSSESYDASGESSMFIININYDAENDDDPMDSDVVISNEHVERGTRVDETQEEEVPARNVGETQEEGGWNDQEVEVHWAELRSEDKVYEIFKCVLKPQTSTYVYIVHMCRIPLFMYIAHAICFVEFVPMCVFQSLISTAITLSVTNVSKKHAFPYICKFM